MDIYEVTLSHDSRGSQYMSMVFLSTVGMRLPGRPHWPLPL